MNEHEESPVVKRLKSMGYRELRKCAKEFGIKGNQKAEKLITLIGKEMTKRTVDWKEFVDTLPDDVTEDESQNFDTEDKCLSPFVKPELVDEMDVTQSTVCDDDMSAISSASRLASLAPGKENTFSKRTRTPNFKKIHEKNFQKMESLDEYIERKKFHTQDLSSCDKRVHFANQRPPILKRRETSYRGSKRELFVKPKKLMNPGIRLNKPQVAVTPFIPTVTSTAHIALNFAASTSSNFAPSTSSKVPVFQFGRQQTPFKPMMLRSHKSAATKPPKENVSTLQGGAKKRFGYVPYTGPVKPFEDCLAKKGNPCLSKTDAEQRRGEIQSFLKGVRTNRRFDLLMEKRGIKLN